MTTPVPAQHPACFHPPTGSASACVPFVRGSLATGMVWYGITRLVQTALLLWLLVTCDPALRQTAPFIICAVVASTLTGVQAYTFVIYAVRLSSKRPLLTA